MGSNNFGPSRYPMRGPLPLKCLPLARNSLPVCLSCFAHVPCCVIVCCSAQRETQQAVSLPCLAQGLQASHKGHGHGKAGPPFRDTQCLGVLMLFGMFLFQFKSVLSYLYLAKIMLVDMGPSHCAMQLQLSMDCL